MISDLLETLKGFTDKRVRISFYIGEGSGLHYFDQFGYIREISDHKVVIDPDPTVKSNIPITKTTLLTEFVAIYGVDELDPEKLIAEEEEKPGEFDDADLTFSLPHGQAPEGDCYIYKVYEKAVIWVRRRKEASA